MRVVKKQPGQVPFAVFRVIEGYKKQFSDLCNEPENHVYERGFMTRESAEKYCGRMG